MRRVSERSFGEDGITEVIETAHETTDRIVLYRDDIGDWYAVVRVNGQGRGFKYQEVPYMMEPGCDPGTDDVVVDWCESALAAARKVP